MKKIKIVAFSLFIVMGFATKANAETDTLRFEVKGNCEMCKERIEEALDVKGVKSADWNVETKMIVVVYDKKKIDENKIHQLIADAGYDTPKAKAKEKVYKNLPGCCQYDRGEGGKK